MRQVFCVQACMSLKNGDFVSFCNNTVDKNWLSQYMESFIVGCSLILWKSNNVPSSFMFMSQGAVVSWTNQEYLYKCLNCITLSHFFKWIGSVFCNHNHISRWGRCIMRRMMQFEIKVCWSWHLWRADSPLICLTTQAPEDQDDGLKSTHRRTSSLIIHIQFIISLITVMHIASLLVCSCCAKKQKAGGYSCSGAQRN